jgi:hypothetical protein
VPNAGILSSCRLRVAGSPARDDQHSRRWSIESVASTANSRASAQDNGSASPAQTAHDITTETRSPLPRASHMTPASILPSKDADFPERQLGCAPEEAHLNARHASGLTLSLQRDSDMVARCHAQVDPRTEVLVGLQPDMAVKPPVGIPAHLHADLDPDRPPRPPRPVASPEIKVDDEADEQSFADLVEGAYATAYRMRAPGTSQLESGIRDVMRREAAMDDAIFRPNLRAMGRIMLPERQVTGQDIHVVTVHKNVRKRKRESKPTD